MCCIGEFIIKFILIAANVLFSLAGLAIAGLGIAAHIQLTQISDLIPVNLTGLSIGIIVLGLIVFLISYLACCGAIQQSMCMLISYSICMAILAGIKIWVAVLVFNFLDTVSTTVAGWINSAFNNQNLRPTFSVMESLFRCCGVNGPNSYDGEIIPPSCCRNPIDAQCPSDDSYNGCANTVTSWFETFGAAIGAVLVGIIVIELLCMVFGFNMANTIRNKRRRGRIN